jgi:hypothetical protein
MISHTLGLVPRFELSTALMRMIETQPKSARHGVLNKKKANELKLICHDYNIPDSGNKETLVARIVAHEADIHDQQLIAANAEEQTKYKVNYNNMTLVELKEECRSRGLPVSGSKAHVVTRLQQNAEAQPKPPPPCSGTKSSKRGREVSRGENDRAREADMELLAERAAKMEAQERRGSRNRRKKSNSDFEVFSVGESENGLSEE